MNECEDALLTALRALDLAVAWAIVSTTIAVGLYLLYRTSMKNGRR